VKKAIRLAAADTGLWSDDVWPPASRHDRRDWRNRTTGQVPTT